MSKNTKKERLVIEDSSKSSVRFRTGLIILIAAGIILFFKAFFNPPASADAISQWYPFTKYRMAYFFEHFSFPLWHPYIHGGLPEMEAGFPLSMSRILTLVLFSPFPSSLGITYFLTVMLGGIFCFLYLKSKQLNDFAAFLAALIYMFSGDMISYFYPCHLKSFVMALVPLTLYFTDKGFESKKIVFFLLSGFLLGLSYMMHPQIFYYFLLFLSCYFFLQLYFLFQQEEKHKAKIIFQGILWFGLMGMTAIAIASPDLFSQYFYQKQISRGMLKSQEEMWNFATSWSHHPLELLTFFIPSLFGLYDSTYLGWKFFMQTTDYLGVITIILVIIGIAVTWRNRTVKFYFVALILMLLFGLGKYFPAYYKIFFSYLPLIKKFRVPVSIYLVATFIMAYLAFFGIAAIFKAKEDKNIRDRIKKVLIITVLGLLILSIWIHTENYKDILMKNISPQSRNSDNQLRRQVAQIIQVHGYQGEQYIKNNVIKKTYDMAVSDMWRMWLWVALFIIIYWSFVSRTMKKKTFQILLTAIIFLDLYIVGRKFIKTTDNQSYDVIDKETPAIKYLKKDPEKFRILPFLNNNIEVNKWGLFGIESVTGYHAVGLRIYEDIQKAGLLNDLDFFGLFNGKYIVSQRPLNMDDLEMVFQSPGGRIVYRNKKFLPRFFLVDKYMTVKEPEQIISMLKQKRINFQETIILEEQPEIDNTVPLSVKENSVEMIKWHTDIIKFKCRITNPCFLFLSEVYYPKWKAYSENKEIKIYKANYLFRSVFLEKGEYIITFKFYSSKSYYITILIHYLFSIIGLILTVKLIKKERDYI